MLDAAPIDDYNLSQEVQIWGIDYRCLHKKRSSTDATG